LLEQGDVPKRIIFRHLVRKLEAIVFWPKCAAENQNQTRFCRSCGADIEVVALALNAQSTLPTELNLDKEGNMGLAQQQAQLQVDGIHRAVRGALIFVTGILLGIPLALFSTNSNWHSNWILVWLVLCGWLPVWGAIILATGLSNLIQSRILQSKIDRLGRLLITASVDQPGRTREIGESGSTGEVSGAVSASEQTTASLNKDRYPNG